MGARNSGTNVTIPYTIETLQLSRGQKTKLTHFCLKQLDHFIGNHDGVLERGKNFSLTSNSVTAQLVSNDIRIQCNTTKRDGSQVPASLLLGNVVSNEDIQKIK